ncbi:MAG TPA: DUF934 domain-containing protein [Methylocystis sp.]|nr:DUF934 domain-containing protein [Methylocystis sp.]
MALISEGRFVEDSWRRLADEESLPRGGNCIVSETRLVEAASELPPQAPLGVLLGNTADPAKLAPYLSRLALVAIAFPAHGDGRGFSLAWLLRRAGFKGELRASGRLIADQATHALRCGFDTIEIASDIASRQDEAQWLAAASAYGAFYQQGYASRETILEDRRKTRA